MSVSIKINGRCLSAEPGQTILEVARSHGIEIPTLCDYPDCHHMAVAACAWSKFRMAEHSHRLHNACCRRHGRENRKRIFAQPAQRFAAHAFS